MSSTETLQVLIAEDDALINEGIVKQLIRLGHTPVGQAYDGPQAVELTCQTHPAVVLMDLQMIDPDTGREDLLAGLKAVRLIQERCPAAVVVLTAHESPDLVRQATEAAISGYLVKPAGDQELDRTIRIARARFDELMEWRWVAGKLNRQDNAMQAASIGRAALSGFLCLCAWCKRIRDQQGLWQEIDIYLQRHSGTRFTHGICPECAENVLGENSP